MEEKDECKSLQTQEYIDREISDADSRINHEITIQAKKGFKKMASYLEEVALNGNNMFDEHLTKAGDVVEVRIPTAVRIAAAKAWKSMVFDKMISEPKRREPLSAGAKSEMTNVLMKLAESMTKGSKGKAKVKEMDKVIMDAEVVPEPSLEEIRPD